jgi:hypothetical protein
MGSHPATLEENVTLFNGQTSSSLTGRTNGLPLGQLLDYALHTPEDPLRSCACVEQHYALIEKNLKMMGSLCEGAAKRPVRHARKAPRR